ncbi:lmo0937 family membrane protein [Paracidobacterium acidisoli]|nr:lmo0937 family membrane protein [Paracidobacterium acidisoli]
MAIDMDSMGLLKNFTVRQPEAVKEAPYHIVRVQTEQKQKERKEMLWTLFVILLIAWLVGLIGFHIVAWYIHVLLVVALVVLIIQLITGRRSVV